MKKGLLILGIVSMLSLSSLYAYSSRELFAAKQLASSDIIVTQELPKDYRLDDQITRKEFMKIFTRFMRVKTYDICEGIFDDVDINDWGCKYIEWALKYSYIAKNKGFNPDSSITKAEAMKLVLQARKIPRTGESNDWRENDMNIAYKKGIIPSQYFDYDTYATRGWIFTAFTEKGNVKSSGGGGSKKISDNINNITDISLDLQRLTPENVSGTKGLINPSVIGQYLDYDGGIIGERKYNVLYFTSARCSSCLKIEENLRSSDFTGYDIQILGINFDTEKPLVEYYGVNRSGIFIQVDEAGSILRSWDTFRDTEDFLNNLYLYD